MRLARAHPAQGCQGHLVAQTLGIVAGHREEGRGSLRANPESASQTFGMQLCQALELHGDLSQLPAQATQLGALAPMLAIVRKGIVTLLLVPALPFAQQAFGDARRLDDMTKRRTGKRLVYRFAFEEFGKTSSGLGDEHTCGRYYPP